MTPRQLEILQHALGVNEYGQIPRGFTEHTRNHFCAGGKDEDICRELVALGFMKQHETTKWMPYFNCSVTPEGIQAVRRESPKAPKVTKARQRYMAYLDYTDCHDCTFREFLSIIKTDWYKERCEA